ncbi:MAG: right-handed parallel beta-helix repeat-containing protein [Chitinophagales bacterium]
MYRFSILILLFCSSQLFAQFSIPEPVVNTGNYTITDTVYMDPNGNDNNPGTFTQPVKSFSTAMQKLPFGTAGVNGGHAYGLIIFKPGHYRPSGSFQQTASNWKNGNTYKNISILGMGDVTIGGTVDSFASNHLLVLCGDHVFVKNIKLKYSTGIGFLLSRPASEPRQNNVLVENVEVDSVGLFAMLVRSADTVLVRNCVSSYAGRPGNEHLTSPCTWPSGIKFLNSTDCTIHDSEIAYTRGEGLNFHNSQRGNAYNNKLHDNGLNFYNDNSTKLMVHHNLIYNTPDFGDQFWRNCPADQTAVWANRGMLIANEGACMNGNFPEFVNCETRCMLPNEVFPNVDSMFVYNNIFQNTGTAIAFWQGVTDIAGANCIRNVYIFNNTIIGVMGSAGVSSTGLVNLFFPNYNEFVNSFYGYLENVRITHNIFTYDTAAYPNMMPVKMDFHAKHPGPKDISFDHNLWINDHSYIGANGKVRPQMPGQTYLLTDSLKSIIPGPDNAYWIDTVPNPFALLTDDYSYQLRNGNTNVGAMEYRDSIKDSIPEDTVSVAGINAKEKIQIFPNPCFNCNYLTISGESMAETYDYRIYSLAGNEVVFGKVNKGKINISCHLSGMYILLLENKEIRLTKKIVLNRN